MLSILAKGAAGHPSAVVTGNIAKTDGLQLAVRATNPLNFRDISDNEYTLSKIATGTLLTPQGILSNGSNGVLVSGFDEAPYDEFTLMGVMGIGADPTQALGLRHFMAGSWQENAKGMGLLLLNDLISGEFRQTIRAVYYGRRTTTNELRFTLTSRVIGVAPVVNTGFPYHYVAMTQDILPNGDTEQRLYVPSIDTTPTIVTTLSASNISFSSAARSPNMTGRDFRIGSVADTTNFESTVHTAKTKETLFYGNCLTPQEVENQYQATKKWLLAEGVVNISHWR